MITFHPMRRGHIEAMLVQAAQRQDWLAMCSDASWDILPHTLKLTGFANGQVVACAGIADLEEPGRALAWSLLSPAAKPHMLGLVRKINRVLSAYPAQVFETAVARDERYAVCERWAAALGFHPTGRLVRDFEAFERVRA